MPVIAAHLTTDRLIASQANYNIASVSVPAGHLVLVSVNSDVDAIKPTLSGLGSAWVEINSASGGPANMRVTTFRSLSLVPRSGVITINFAGTLPSSCGWSVAEFGNVDQSGLNGENAIAQSAVGNDNAVATFLITLASFSSVDNATYGVVTLNGNGTITQGSGYTELGESDDTRSIQSQFRAVNDITVDWTFSGLFVVAGVALEIKFSTIDLTSRNQSYAFFM